MFDYQELFQTLNANGMASWGKSLQIDLENYIKNINHGDYATWLKALNGLPEIKVDHYDFNQAMVEIGKASDCDEQQRQQLKKTLKILMPWRKGPFDFFGIEVDAEWRSDMKWNRLQNAISSLQDKMVLDIGCGNGYYALRMLGQGAKCVVGIDPTLRFILQFQAVKKYLPDIPVYLLPIAVQDLSHEALSFDTVFSMGVIYHRRNAKEHLQQLHEILKTDGELILESLVIDEHEFERYGDVLIPDKRYAKMNNVWAIPSVNTLMKWLKESGFYNSQVVDVTQTTVEEQRVTKWMEFESLADFLDPEDRSKTIEGYPAPKRVIIVAKK